MKISAHVLFWLTIWGLSFLAAPFIQGTDGQVARIKTEVASVRAAFGEAKTDEIVENVGLTYKSIFIDSGLLTEKNKLYTKDPDPMNEFGKIIDRPSKAFSNATNGYVRAISVNVYGLMIRWAIILHWALFIFPFLIAAFADGFVTRKIKFTEFGYISPMGYSVSIHFIIFMLFVPLIYLVAPLPITPYFMPGWAMLMGFPINLMVSNTQRLFNS